MPYVTDTHSIVWHMTGDTSLSAVARTAFEKADQGEDRIVIPCIVLFELLYLTEKGKVAVDFLGFVSALGSARNYRIEPLCLPIIQKTRLIARKDVPDPWDRLIAATSMHLGFPLITRDRSLRRLGLQTIW